MSNNTVLWAIKQAMAEMALDLPIEAVSSVDGTITQLVSLLDTVGNELVVAFNWSQLTKDFNFTTNGSSASYPLPADFSHALPQTQWDQTNHWQVMGPKTAQEWQTLKSGSLSSGPRIRYRFLNDRIEVFPADSIVTINFEYVSRNWLQDANVANTFYDYPQADSNILLLDKWLVVKYLKLKFWEAKGFNTTAYLRDFMSLWENKIGKNKTGPTLSLTTSPGQRLIGPWNVPESNWDTNRA